MRHASLPRRSSYRVMHIDYMRTHEHTFEQTAVYDLYDSASSYTNQYTCAVFRQSRSYKL